MQALSAANNIAAIAAQSGASRDVASAIHKASARTGVDFSYLMNQAKAESNFNPAAKAKTSSATGLYQFIESTWMRMVKTHGQKYGLDAQANAITQKADGSFSVSSSMRKAILDLRKDPEVASAMAAEFAAENKAYLQERVGGDIGATDMYFAHFLGARGASGFLNQMNETPNAQAADYFPKAAQSNRNVFYDPNSGKPRTFAQVYEFFDKKFNSSSDELYTKTAGAGAIASSDRATSTGGSGHFLSLSIQNTQHQLLTAMMALPAPLAVDEGDSLFRTSKDPFSFLNSPIANPIDLILEAQKQTYTGT